MRALAGERGAVAHDPPEPARRRDAGEGGRVGDGAADAPRRGPDRRGAVDRRRDAGGDFVEGLVPLVGRRCRPAARRCPAARCTSARVERQREGDVRAHRGEGVGAGDHDRVDAGLLGEDLRLAGVAPAPRRRRPSSRCSRRCATAGCCTSACVTRRLGSRRRAARRRAVEAPARPAPRAATATVRASGRIAPGCGFTITVLPVARLAKSAGIAVPGREGRAADDERHAARHDPPVLFEHDRRGLALWLLPARGGRVRGSSRPRHRRPPPARGPARAARRPGRPSAKAWPVVCITALRHLEAQRVQPHQHLEADADARLWRGGGPGGAAASDGGDQRLDVGGGIGDAERRPPGRDSAPTRPASGWPVKRERRCRAAPRRRRARPRARSRHRSCRWEPPGKASRIPGHRAAATAWSSRARCASKSVAIPVSSRRSLLL